MHSPFSRYARKFSSALICAAGVIAAGCHHNDLNSGYGVGWVTLSDSPGDFTSYIVNVDSVTLTGATVGVITAVATVETVDFTKLNNISELWSAAPIPNDTYTSATIILDYTSANISLMVNGQPQKATVVDTTGVAATTQTINVTLDKNHQFTVVPTLSSSSAGRLAIDFDLAASNVVNLATNPATVTVKPIMTVTTSAPDSKPIRIRGPMINSDAPIGTFTVEVRPFFDEVDSLGSLTVFGDASTVYLVNGITYVGSPGVTAMSLLSADTTMVAAYTTFEPTPTLNSAVTAGKFNATYVVAGSTLEDFYTQGLEGDVIARSGNTVTLLGSTLQLNDGTSQYNNTPNAVVLLGPSTIVTADDNTILTGLDYNSISVGQHIIARGIYSLPASNVVTLDATGDSSTNTGSVRIVSTELWGSLVSSASGGLVLDLQTIDNWPVSDYDFTGNGAGAVLPAAYAVNTGTLVLPAGTVAGSPLWIDGFMTPFGSAPPDFKAFSLNAELSVPATLQVGWTGAGTTTPFATLTDTGLTIDLSNANYGSGLIRVGSEAINLKTLAATPQIVPQAAPAATPGLPAVFMPVFGIGGLTAADITTIAVFNSFADFVAQLPVSIVAASPATKFTATGVYNRGNNTFTASRIDVVN